MNIFYDFELEKTPEEIAEILSNDTEGRFEATRKQLMLKLRSIDEDLIHDGGNIIITPPQKMKVDLSTFHSKNIERINSLMKQKDWDYISGRLPSL